MKNLFRSLAVLTMALGMAVSAEAQQGPSRAEVECLMLASSSARAPRGDKAAYPSFHHVYLSDLTYGQFTSGDLQLNYEVEGRGGEIIIVVHGGPGMPHDDLHPALSNLTRNFRLVYFDRRADMLSQRGPQPVSIDEMADDIEALRLELGQARINLFGHSFGGAVALNYAVRYPAHVERLLLVNTSATLEKPADIEQRLAGALAASERAAFSGEGTQGGGSPCERIRARYAALYPLYFHKTPDRASLERGAYQAYFDMLARKLATAGDDFDVRGRLQKVAAPALIFGGRYDQVTPLGYASELAQLLPQSRLVVMEKSGHYPFLEENFMFTEWVRQFMQATSDMMPDEIVRSAPAEGGGR